MISSTYRTGSWLGIVRSGSVIVLESNTNPAIVNRLWDFLGQAPTIHGVLNAVTAEFGTGLTGLPHFAILVQSDKLHAILRGDITLLAQLNGSAELVSGRDVSTWSERSLQLPESLELTLADDAGDVLELPVDEAVVRLQGLQINISQSPGAGLGLAGAETADSDAASFDVPADAAGIDVPASDANAFDDTVAGTASPDSAAFEAEAHASAANDPTLASYTIAHDTEAGFPSAPAEAGAAWAPESPAAVEPVPEFDGGAATAGAATSDADSATDVQDAGEEDAYASFAMAAEAADAEWSAQLAPVEAIGDEEPNDLNLTIRPELHDGEVAAESADAHQADSEPEPAEYEPAGYEQADYEPAAAEQAMAETPEDAQEAGGGADGLQDPAENSSADEESFTTNYDHLWGPTVARSVEDAAVRLDENGLPLAPTDAEAVAAEPMLPPLPPLPPLAGNGNDTPANGVPAAEDSAPFAPESGHTPGDAFAAPAAPDAGQGADPLMIESVPWGNPAARAAAQYAEQPAAVSGFDPDHDGQTIMSGQYQGDVRPAAVEPLESRPPTGPMVLARMCPHGHANPPSRSQCSDCGALINSEPREVGRPRLGTMHISSGESVELDHSLIIGRQPSVSRVMGGAMPRLVQVKSGNDDISRSHVEVRLDGWDVLLVDLKATNGTVLVREGQAPRRLSQGEEAILLNGDIAELGDGISLLFDGLL